MRDGTDDFSVNYGKYPECGAGFAVPSLNNCEATGGLCGLRRKFWDGIGQAAAGTAGGDSKIENIHRQIRIDPYI